MQKCEGKLGERIRLKLGLILRDGLRFIREKIWFNFRMKLET